MCKIKAPRIRCVAIVGRQNIEITCWLETCESEERKNESRNDHSIMNQIAMKEAEEKAQKAS
jgi:hypothetical protein